MSVESSARDRYRATAGLWIAAGLAALVHVALWQISEPAALFSDFYKAYYPAAEEVAEHGSRAEWPFTEVGAGGFVNLPIFAWAFVPLVAFGEDGAGWVFLGIGLSVTLLAGSLTAKAVGARGAALPLIVVLFLLNGPLINSLREGNTTHIVLALIAGGVLLLQGRRDVLAGALLGLAGAIKLPLLLLGAYLLWRRRWGAVAGTAAVVGGIAAASVAIFGIGHHTGWFTCCVAPFIGGIIPAFNVQSIDGFAIRLFTGTSQLLHWDPIVPPDGYRLARYAVFAAVLAATYLATRRADRGSPARIGHGGFGARDLMEISVVLVLALLLSPIAWTHYYLLLLLPFAAHLSGALALPDDRLTRGLMWSAMGLASLPVVILPLQPDLVGEIAARTVVSAWFFGACALLVALLRGLWRLGDHRPGGV